MRELYSAAFSKGGEAMTTTDISALAAWMKQNTDAIKFGEVTTRIILHDGKARIEKTVVIKEQVENKKEKI